MPDEPVTRSCEQCGRRHALLVPEPGSGDLALRRITALLGWCAECGRLVGRDCCWGPDRSCARCALARAASGDAEGGFAALGAARAAVRQLDGMSAQFSSVEEAIAATAVRGPGALVAWKDSWLAAGVLRARIDGSSDAARSWLRALPSSEQERASELYEELLGVEASLETRWQSIEAALSVAGERLAKRPGVRRPVDAAPAGRARATPPAPVAVAIPIPISEPDRAIIRVRPSAPANSPVQPVAASIRAPVASLDRPTRMAAVSAPIRSRPPAQHVLPTVIPAAARPDAAAKPAMADDRGERPGRTANLLIAVVALALAAGILAVTRLPGAVADGTPGAGGVIDADAESTNGAGTASSTPLSSADAPTPPPTVVTVDEHPMGPINSEELPVTRVIGDPQVEAFPSPFDRSLRLGSSSGLCVASASSAGVPSLAFDVHFGEIGTGGGRLVVAFAGHVFVLDLASFTGLDRSAWYRLTVTADDGAGRAAVAAVADGSSQLEIELAGAGGTATATAGEACLSSELQAADASVFVDNLRVDS